MLYVPLCIGLLQHHKLHSFMDAAGIDTEAEAVGALACMWAWAMAQEIPEDGLIPEMGDRSWAKMLGIQPERVEEVRSGMIEARFIDTTQGRYRIHNWAKYGGKVMADRQRKAEYARSRRVPSRSGDVPETYQPRTGTLPERSTDVPATSEPKSEQNKSKQSKAILAQPDGFAEWYGAYPRKVGKPAALKAWVKLTQSQRDTASNVVKQYANAMQGKDVQYIPNPATYLNQHRFDDPIPSQASSPQRGQPPAPFTRELDEY